MTRIFRLDASIRHDGSVTRELADIVQAQLDSGRTGDARVVRRDVGLNPVSASTWPTVTGARHLPAEERTAEQAAAMAFAQGLVDEATTADVIVLAVPLYNFGVSQHTKAWIDVLNTDPGILGGDGPLAGKPAVLVTARGGGYAPGTPREGWDHSTPYLRRIFADAWKLDLTVVECELTLADVTPAMVDLRDLAARQLEEARHAAAAAGRTAAARIAVPVG